MPGPNLENCGSCYFRDIDGWCRRYPPTILYATSYNETIVESPRMAFNDWCGEYKPMRSGESE